MLNIIKYEFLRKYKLLLMIIVSAIIINIIAIVNAEAEGSAMFLGLFPFAMILLYIADVIKMYSEDLNKKSGYMLFMTPNSGYKIIVSKVITAVLEGFSILLLYFIFIVINGYYIIVVTKADINYNEVLNAINMFLNGSFGFNLGHIFVLLIAFIIFIISFIMTAYMSITIRKSIFSETKFGGFLSFIIFIALNSFGSYASGKILNIFSPYYNNNFTIIENRISVEELVLALMPIIVLSIIESVVMIIGSGYLLEKKINL